MVSLPGDHIGRYVVERQIGAGTMGVVLVAHDPELDRRVALKLLKQRGDGREAERLRREAQALAMVDHPNVVAVLHVAEHEERVFVVMEYVEGRTLRAWIDEGPHDWRAVVEVFEGAGRGLAAVHARDLVHRDFKPDNVIIGADGRVRVMDFGLTRPRLTADDAAPALGTDRDPATSSSLSSPITRTGAFMGSPAYMAPELFVGGEATASSDQFSFCVALHEALFGARPFRGTTLEDLAVAVMHHDVHVPANGTPRWLRELILRGLSADAARRFPSMQALLTELHRGRTRRRNRGWIVAGGAVALALAGVWGAEHWQAWQRQEQCTVTASDVDAVWNDDARTAVRDGLLASNVGYAQVVADKTIARLDAYVQTWHEHARASCALATRSDTASLDAHDRAQWCLESRRLALASLVEELSTPTDHTLQGAIQSVAGLSSPSECTDPATLERASAPPDLSRRPAVQRISAAIARAAALQRAGRHDEALPIARTAITDAEALPDAALAASARLEVAACLRDAGDYAAVEREADAAYLAATQAEAWDVAARAAIMLAQVVGRSESRPADGLAWARHAEAAILRAGDPSGLHEAARRLALAEIREAEGDLPKARAALEGALEVFESTLGPEHPRVASTLGSLGDILIELGEYDEAHRQLSRAETILAEVLGPEHPDVGRLLVKVANLHYARGEYDTSEAEYERALKVLTASLGAMTPAVARLHTSLGNVMEAKGDYARAMEEHRRALEIAEAVATPDDHLVGTASNNLGMVLAILGRSDEARSHLTRALAIWEEALGPEHPDVALTLANLGSLHAQDGELQPARALLGRAVAIWETSLGPTHPRVAMALANLGQLHADLGDDDGAADLLARAVAIWDAMPGPQHPYLAHTLTHLGQARLRGGDHSGALEILERAVAIRSAGDGAPAHLADARFALAQALWDAPSAEGRDRERAARLAIQARDGYLADGASSAIELATAELWLAERDLMR